jgi:hypothetical protein
VVLISLVRGGGYRTATELTRLSAALGNVFNKLKTKTSSLDINMAMGTFLMALRTINPRFDEKG